MAGLNDLKRRIKSVQNTRQVTKAMQAVSASKMRKAVDRAIQSRRYSHGLWEMVTEIRRRTTENGHPLLQQRPVRRSLGILISSDKGLCGGLNAAVIKTFLKAWKEREQRDISVELVSIGKKGNQQLRRHAGIPTSVFEGLSDQPNVVQVRGLTRSLLQRYEHHELDEVFVAYTDFRSTLKQAPRVIRVLPIGEDPIQFDWTQDDTKVGKTESALEDVLFEPRTRDVMDSILPRLVEVELFQLLLEASASEHSARMMAMSNATENASEMIEELQLTYNQARQAAITQEIAEIAAGRAALETI